MLSTCRSLRKFFSTINKGEIDKFRDSKWWDENDNCKALHSLNALRVPLILDSVSINQYSLCGTRILDVGCGGGLLSERLARLGATVVALDPLETNISIANAHRDESLKDNLTYIHSSLEDYIAQNGKDKENGTQSFDAVVASEVLEHVDDKESFLSNCSSILRSQGSLIITTLNKNHMSWMSAILGAEVLLGLLPQGTHDWHKFIQPSDLENILSRCNVSIQLIHGLIYIPFWNKWIWSKNTSVNYAVIGVKN